VDAVSPERLVELWKKSLARDVFTISPSELDFLILRATHADSAARDVDSLALKLDAAEHALDRIANHPHCSYPVDSRGMPHTDRQYEIGVADGHRCAAEIARAALAKAAK